MRSSSVFSTRPMRWSSSAAISVALPTRRWSRFWKFCFVVSLTFSALFGDFRRHLGAVHLHSVVESGKTFGDLRAKGRGVGHHEVGDFAATDYDRIFKLLQARNQRFLDRVALGGERDSHLIRGLLQFFHRANAACSDRVRNLAADLGKGVGGFLAAAEEGMHDLVAGGVDVRARGVGLGDEIVDDAVRDFGNRVVDPLADAIDVDGERVVHAGDRLLQALRVGHDAVALALQAFDQGAHAHFVVVIGALERCDFGAHEGLSSAARATARSMPSPSAATSRRICWPTLTKASEAMPSGSAKREVISAIAPATKCICCERRYIIAKAKKPAIGSTIGRPAARRKADRRAG